MLHSFESHHLTCSTPLFFSSPPSLCSCPTDTSSCSSPLPHVSCSAPPHLDQSGRRNDRNGCTAAVKHLGLLQWTSKLGAPSPAQVSHCRVVVHVPWTTAGPAKVSLHSSTSLPLPQGNHFPYTDSLICSWLNTHPTSLVSAHTYTFTSTWSAAGGRNPRGGRAIDVPCMAGHQLRKLPY